MIFAHYYLKIMIHLYYSFVIFRFDFIWWIKVNNNDKLIFFCSRHWRGGVYFWLVHIIYSHFSQRDQHIEGKFKWKKQIQINQSQHQWQIEKECQPTSTWNRQGCHSSGQSQVHYQQPISLSKSSPSIMMAVVETVPNSFAMDGAITPLYSKHTIRYKIVMRLFLNIE